MQIRKSAIVCACAGAVLGVLQVADAQTVSQSRTPVQQTGVSAQAAPPPAAPIPLGVNGQLASWLQVRGELRTRFEGFTGGGFTPDNDDGYWMDRFRLNATMTPTKSLRFFVQAHDARGFDKTSGSLAVPLRDTFDLRQAYGEIGSASTLRAGRQELAFGEQRLLGHVSWLNTARTFDGVRGTLKRQGVQVDAFAASVVTIRPDAFNKSGSGNLLYGVYGSFTALVPKQTIEPYFFWRQSDNLAAELGGTATLRQATTGVRAAGRLPSEFDYSGEAAIQTGSLGPDGIKAWGGHGLIGKTWSGITFRPRIFGEYNYASGDDNRLDGTRGTFDQLYPTPHDKYGLADQVGWRNINHVRTGVELKATANTQVAGGYHSWWLSSATDALYNAGGAAVARSVTGTAGRHVGQEIDAQLVYTYSPQLQVGGGYAYLIPGEFLKNTTPGHAYSYPYLMITYVFLGEKPAIGGRRSPQ